MILVVAYNKNFAIAEDGEIPWYIPEDFKHFKETTDGGTVIMGRVTYDSLPDKFKPLPNRKNIVITRNPVAFMQTISEGSQVGATQYLETAKRLSEITGEVDKTFVIGGSQIYDLAFECGYVTKVIASEVENDAKGDRFFPDLRSQGWKSTIVKQFDQFKVVEFTPDAS